MKRMIALALLVLAPLAWTAWTKEKPKEPSSPEGIAEALGQMGEPEFARRRSAHRQLLAGGMAALPALVDALKKSEAAALPRMPALATLQEAASGRPRREEVRHLLSRITGASFRTSSGWSTWLEKNGNKKREDLVGAELKSVPALLASKNAPDRCNGLSIVLRLGDEKAHAKLVEPFLNDRDPKVKKLAVLALGEIASSKTAAGLKAHFGARDAWLRQEALAAASRAGLSEAKAPLKVVAGDAKHPVEAAHAVLDMAWIGEDDAVSLAAQGLGRKADRDFHLLYAEALGHFPKDQVLAALRKVLGSKKTEDPLMPAAALAALGDKDADVLKHIAAAFKTPLPPPNPKDPDVLDQRVRARQDRLAAARVVADLLADQPLLRAQADDVFKTFQLEVNAAVEKGVKALKETQEKQAKGQEGTWSFMTSGWRFPSFQTGASALALMALLKSGVKPDDPSFARGLAWVVANQDAPPKLWQTFVYPQAMVAILLSEVDPAAHHDRIQKAVDWIRAGQLVGKPDPARAGQWNYMGDQTAFQASNSNTHFALLGICFAGKNMKGLTREFWQASLDYWMRVQRVSGGWSYDKGMGQGDSYGTMTAAGVTSILVCQSALLEDGFPEFDARGHLATQQALDFLADRFEDGRVPDLANAGQGSGGLDHVYYWYYTVERMGLVLGTEYLGNRHWYHDLASRLLELQAADGAWVGTSHSGEVPAVSTSFALLLLRRAPLPIRIQTPRPYEIGEAEKAPPAPEAKPEPEPEGKK